jgi:beta-N-acetylhexosaminidase
MKRALFLALVLMVLLTACRGTEQASSPTPALPSTGSQVTQPPEPSESVLPEPISAAEELLNSMTLEEKIGQLFIIRPESLKPDLTPQQVHNPNKYAVTSLDAQMAEKLKNYHVGGIALFGKNIVSPEQLTALISTMQQNSKIPLFISTDEEGGSVSRVANAQNFDVPQHSNMQDIGATGDSREAKKVGVTIGAYLKQYGFNLDFAPVADVNTNPENIVIGSRSFGSDPNLVADMVAAEIWGLHESGVMSCVKHYPGHGDTEGDTHEGFVSITKTWEELKDCELIPFIKAIALPTDMVMISHITAPNITSDKLPASLSYEMVQEKLRGELGFTGVIITDAMEMGAISNEYSSADSAVRAISAGIDIILMPGNFTDAYNGVLTAVQEGKISEERINESVLRILELKEQYGLLQ